MGTETDKYPRNSVLAPWVWSSTIGVSASALVRRLPGRLEITAAFPRSVLETALKRLDRSPHQVVVYRWIDHRVKVGWQRLGSLRLILK